MKSNLVCSAGTREQLQEMINRYFYSDAYSILDDLTVYNSRTGKTLDSYTVRFARGRWRFELSR